MRALRAGWRHAAVRRAHSPAATECHAGAAATEVRLPRSARETAGQPEVRERNSPGVSVTCRSVGIVCGRPPLVITGNRVPRAGSANYPISGMLRVFSEPYSTTRHTRMRRHITCRTASGNARAFVCFSTLPQGFHMLKRFLVLSAIVVTTLAGTDAALAADRKVRVINKTKTPIFAFYASRTSTNDWEEDILGDDVIMPGKSLTID